MEIHHSNMGVSFSNRQPLYPLKEDLDQEQSLRMVLQEQIEQAKVNSLPVCSLNYCWAKEKGLPAV